MDFNFFDPFSKFELVTCDPFGVTKYNLDFNFFNLFSKYELLTCVLLA